jgi:hypothetical protein
METLDEHNAANDRRRYGRTQEFGVPRLNVSFRLPDGSEQTCEARLWDFGSGGLGMDSPRAFQSGEIVLIESELRGSAYSMHLSARARVAYCRKVEGRSYRVGVAFLDVAYRPI